jgi:probable rRNA maturation factor
MFKFTLTKQIRKTYQPKRIEVASYIKKALLKKFNVVNINITIVSEDRSQALNLKYRGIDKATNVISLEYPDDRDRFNLLSGDLILCDAVIVKEAKLQNKDVAAHYVHMIIHGILHLQGLDHEAEDEAIYMEQLEIKMLQEMGFQNPYKE